MYKGFILDSEQIYAGMLNFHIGLISTVVLDILQNIDQEELSEQIFWYQEEGQQAITFIHDARKLTAGSVL